MAAHPPNVSIAYFITPHGFGHAARAAAVMEALPARVPRAKFSLFTSVPEWFFEKSLSVPFDYHEIPVDVGLVQKTPLMADYDKTRIRLEALVPFQPHLIDRLAAQLKAADCALVVCDIAALGIAAARAAGIPSVLIENFTWDWIYAGIDALAATISPVIEELQRLYAGADYRIQTEPLCEPVAADLLVGPISRRPRRSRAETRQKLAVADDTRLILITMGGVAQDYRFLNAISVTGGVHLLISGDSQGRPNDGRVTWLPFSSEYYHPDLVHACDAVVGKTGYSTIAEVYHAGVPFGYMPVSGFRESEVLARFIDSQMCGLRLSTDDFFNGNWFDQMAQFAGSACDDPPAANGSEPIAEFIAGLIAARARKA